MKDTRFEPLIFIALIKGRPLLALKYWQAKSFSFSSENIVTSRKLLSKPTGSDDKAGQALNQGFFSLVISILVASDVETASILSFIS